MTTHRYEVVCGNIGSVYSGPSAKEATEKFRAYVDASKSQYGRAAGESVTLFKNGEPIREHVGSLDDKEGDA